jgi:signal peptidase I
MYNAEAGIQYNHKYNPYELIAALLKKGEFVKAQLFGHCMRPVINNGDIAVIAPVKLKEIACGDIIVYKNNDRLKIHRFLGYKKISGQKYLITKGDKSVTIDPPILPSLFLGKIITVQKRNGTLYLNSFKWRIVNYILGKTSRPIVYLNYFKRIVKRKVKNIIT